MGAGLALEEAGTHPPGGDGVLKHAADGGGQGPRLPPQQALHAALGRQQGEVRQASAGVEAEELVAIDGNIDHVCEGSNCKEEKV